MIRETDEYAEMDSFKAAMIAEGVQEPESEDQMFAAWQYLHDTGLAYSLQGWYGRSAQNLIEQGLIED